MTTTPHPGDRLNERILRWQRGDPDGVLADGALIEAAQLWWRFAVKAGNEGLDVALHLLGWLHWARFVSGPEPQQQLERQISLEFFQLLWQRNPEAVPPEMRRHFRDAKVDPIEDVTEHANGILRDIATVVITESRDTGIRLYDLSEWPPGLPPEHSAPPLLRVAQALASRHGETGDIADLDAAVAYGEQAVALAPDPDELRANVLQDVSVVLCARFDVTSAMPDSDRAIAMLDEALEITCVLVINPAVLLTNRSLARLRRFFTFQQLADLQLAKIDAQAVLAALAPDSPRVAAVSAHLSLLSEMLALQSGDNDLDFDIREEPDELWEEIEVGRSAILAAWPNPTAPEPNIDLLPKLYARAHQNLHRRIRRAQATGNDQFVLSTDAMTDAAYLWWLAQRLTAMNPASPSIPLAREILGEFHIQRHNATVSTRRPDELVQTLMYWLSEPDAVRDSLREPLDRMIGPAAEPAIQTSYAATLIHFARQQRNSALVKAAILLLTAAVEATGAEDPELPERLGRLSDAYLTRGQDDDLEIAAELAADAVALVPTDHPEAGQHRERMKQARSLRLRETRRPITPDPIGHRVFAFAMTREFLGTSHGAEMAAQIDALWQGFAPVKVASSDSERFLREFQRDGLAVSLELARLAAEAQVPREDASGTEQYRYLLHLGEIHHERYLLTRDGADLAETVRLLQEALTAAPRITPIRAEIVNGLATMYAEQLRTEGFALDDAHLEELCLAARSTNADATATLRALRGAGRLSLRHERYDLAVTCYREAVATLRSLVLEELDREDQAARLAHFTEVGSEAVTAHILAGNPDAALEVAEEARGAALAGPRSPLRPERTPRRAARPGRSVRPPAPVAHHTATR